MMRDEECQAAQNKVEKAEAPNNTEQENHFSLQH